MKIIKGLVKGPFKDEAAFKKTVLRRWNEKSPWFTRFQIENEEKEPGMPDVLSVSNKLPAFFTEFKISDTSGVIEFQKTQPLFYARHEDLLIDILVWDAPRKRVVQISPSEILGYLTRGPRTTKKILFKIPEEIDDVEAAG